LIRWRGTYPDAGSLVDGDLDPLPRHLLETALRAVETDPGSLESFLAQPFWTREYVGAGPYRLDRWEPGSLFQASAFDGHALGRPRIDRIVLRIMADENTVFSTVLAGN